MDYLPSSEEQSYLLDFLAKLIARRGQETFLQAPLLLPTEAFFPDPWSPDTAGVRRLAQRLLRYAGLGRLQVSVQLYENPEEVKALDLHGRPGASSHEGAAAWYAGMPGGVCQFGAEASQLSQPEGIVGCMCHEAAHAYRHYHRLEHQERDLEERLTDLTTIYLGFGVLTVNTSYRYRSQSLREGPLGASRYSHQRMGYLSPQAMSFLLAVQGVARALSPAEKKTITKHLETNQRAYFKAAFAHWEKKREELLQRLGLSGSEETAPAAPSPTARPVSLERKGQFNLFLPVFRVPKSLAGLAGVLGLGLGSAAAFLAYQSFSSLALSAGMATAGGLMGFLAGSRIKRDICSDPQCGATLSPGIPTCARCGGVVRGALPSQKQHREASLRVLQHTREESGGLLH